MQTSQTRGLCCHGYEGRASYKTSSAIINNKQYPSDERLK